MKTITFLIVIILFTPFICFSQKPSYQSSIDFTSHTTLLFIGFYSTYDLEIVNGLRVNEMFYCGIGTGLSGFSRYNSGPESVPLFIDIKAYLIKNSKSTPFITMDVGYKFDLDSEDSTYGFFFVPGVGAYINIIRGIGFTISSGCQIQQLPLRRTKKWMYSATSKVGLSFTINSKSRP